MNTLKNIFSKKYINKYKKKISYLGLNNKLTVEYFLVVRLFISITLFILLLFIPKYGLLLALIGSISFYYLYTLILLDNKIKIRSDKLYDEAILFLNMLKTTLLSTNDLKVALDIVSNKIGNSLALEFRMMLGNNKYNNDLNYVFRKVIDTIPNSDVRKALISLKECSFDNETLDKILDELKDKNLILIKENIKIKLYFFIIVGVIFLSIITLLILNINDISTFISNLV